ELDASNERRTTPRRTRNEPTQKTRVIPSGAKPSTLLQSAGRSGVEEPRDPRHTLVRGVPRLRSVRCAHSTPLGMTRFFLLQPNTPFQRFSSTNRLGLAFSPNPLPCARQPRRCARARL